VAHPDNLAGHLEAGAEGSGRHRVVQPLPHEQVGEVDAGGVHAEVHLLRTRIGEGHVALDQHIRPAVALDEYGSGGLLCHGS
jgi:hypothetical protein